MKRIISCIIVLAIVLSTNLVSFSVKAGEDENTDRIICQATLEDDFADDYYLNVSSSGLDRKIVTNDDYRRALDTEIECFDGSKKKTHGTLVAYDADTITLKTEGKNPKNIVLTRKNLTKVQPYVRF